MQLVLLAAGHGRRFGGLKQLAPVADNGDALMDYTARDALAAGFGQVILIVRDDVRQELEDHIHDHWPKELDVVSIVQGPIAGTAQAVASAAPVLKPGTAFGVANADDLYGPTGLRTLAENLQTLDSDEHLIVSYHLADTVLTDAPVTRGICEVDASGHLERIVEHTVQRQRDGTFRGRPLRATDDDMEPLPATAVVSMNLWGFSPGVLATLDTALELFDPTTAPHSDDSKPPELLLPDVIGQLVSRGDGRVRVVAAEGRVIGITHPDDLPLVRSIVAGEEAADPRDSRDPRNDT